MFTLSPQLSRTQPAPSSVSRSPVAPPLFDGIVHGYLRHGNCKAESLPKDRPSPILQPAKRKRADQSSPFVAPPLFDGIVHGYLRHGNCKAESLPKDRPSPILQPAKRKRADQSSPFPFPFLLLSFGSGRPLNKPASRERDSPIRSRTPAKRLTPKPPLLFFECVYARSIYCRSPKILSACS